MSQIIIAVVITAVIVAFLSWNLAIAHRKKTYESKIGSAEARSREIIEEALKTAETKKREALLEAKEESLRTKNELERETKERRAELQHYENRVLSKEENLDKKQAALEKREAALVSKEEKINERSREVDSLYDKGIAELERIAGLSTEEAKEFLLQSVEEDVKHDTARLIPLPRCFTKGSGKFSSLPSRRGECSVAAPVRTRSGSLILWASGTPFCLP